MHPMILLFRTMTRSQKISLVWVSVFLLIGAVMEITGVGVILPIVHFIQHPAALLTDPRLGPIFRTLDIHKANSAMILLAILVVGVFVLKNVLMAFQTVFINRRMARMATEFSISLLCNYIYLPYTEFAQTQNSRLIRNLTAEVQIACNALRSVLAFLAEVVVTIGLIAMLWYAEPVAALIATGIMVVIGGITTRVVRRRLRAVAKTRQFEEGERLRWLRRAFGGFKEIRVLGRESHFIESFRTSTFRVYNAVSWSAYLSAIPPLILEVVAVVALVTFLVVLLAMGRDPSAIFAVIALFGVAAIRLMPATKKIVTGINILRFQVPSVEVVAEEFARSKRLVIPSSKSGPMRLGHSLSLENVTFCYPGVDRPAVRDFSLTIQRGEKIGIVGPSGAGKTTLVDIVLGLLVPTEGEVLVDGTSIYNDIVAWQKTIGYIPQAIYLSDDTLRRNIAFGISDDDIDEPRIWACLQAAQLADFVADLSEGLETWAGERGIRLSGGQRQRIGIARALYHDPQLIVLDEATSQLDTETERLLDAAIRDLARDRTLLVIAHRLGTVRNADRICAMSDGRIEGIGSYEELRLTSSLFQRLLDSSEIKTDGDRIPDAIRS